MTAALEKNLFLATVSSLTADVAPSDTLLTAARVVDIETDNLAADQSQQKKAARGPPFSSHMLST